MQSAFRLICLASTVALFGASPPSSAKSALLGIWDTDSTPGDDLRGPITVTADRAALAGFTASAKTEGIEQIYRFPGRRGALRVDGLATGKPTAFWVQPKTISGSSYATPVLLQQVKAGVWRGPVEPLANRIVMALHVVRDAKGTLTAFLRDPLYNLGRRFGTMTVSADDDRVRFEGHGPVMTARLDGPDALVFTLPDGSLPPLRFIRRTVSAPPADPTYRQPLATGDGWPIASARAAGLATSSLEDLARFIVNTPITSVSSPAVQAVLVARHGKLVFDDYFARFDEATLHDTRSAGKTYADVLAGAAIEAGVPLGGRTLLLPLFPNYGALENPDPRKARVTLGNALSMSTGLDCDDNDPHSVANEDNEQNQTAQPDWYRLVFDARMVRDPGTKAVYCSASINLAGGAVASVTHAWLPAYFAEHVAEPLQMQRYALNLTPTGQWYLGGGAYVRPRDFLKIGQLFLDGGTWQGHRVLPRSWIEQSWDAHLSFTPDDRYGYAWHVRSYKLGGVTYRAYEAQGNGGQILDVIPQLDLTVMIAQGNYNNFRTWGPTRDTIVGRVIGATARP